MGVSATFSVSEVRKRSTGALHVQCDNPLECADWDRRFSNAPRFSTFHSAGWAAVLQRTYGFRPLYFNARKDGEPQALLPCMELRSPITGVRGASLPFTDSCEPLGSRECQEAMVEAALDHGRTAGWRYLELRGAPLPCRFHEAPASLTFLGHRLSLFNDREFHFRKLDSAVRRAIRKAEKSGLRIELGHELRDIQSYYRLHCETRREHGLPPQPFQFFRTIHEELIGKGHGTVISAMMGERPAASAVFLHDRNQVIYKFGASDRRHQELRGNNLVMWEAISHFGRQGYKTLEFGRTSVAQEGLRRYKLGWGAEEYRIAYHKYDFRRNDFVTEKDGTAGWHVGVFRAMPIPIARLAGRILYRHVG